MCEPHRGKAAKFILKRRKAFYPLRNDKIWIYLFRFQRKSHSKNQKWKAVGGSMVFNDVQGVLKILLI